MAARAFAAPIDSKCLATSSSGFILSATDDREVETMNTNTEQAIRAMADCFLIDNTFILNHKRKQREIVAMSRCFKSFVG